MAAQTNDIGLIDLGAPGTQFFRKISPFHKAHGPAGTYRGVDYGLLRSGLDPLGGKFRDSADLVYDLFDLHR